MKPLIIFGNGEFAQLMHHYFESDAQRTVAGFCVDGQHLNDSSFCGLPIVATEELPQRFPSATFDMFVALGIGQVNELRAAKVEQMESLGYHLQSFVSSKAIVPPNFVPKPNTCIMEQAHFQPWCEVGKNTIVWPHCLVGLHSRIGNHCWMVVSTLGETVAIGDFSFVGLGAVISSNVTVGKSNIIGAGALIKHDTADFAVYRGQESPPLEQSSKTYWR